MKHCQSWIASASGDDGDDDGDGDVGEEVESELTALFLQLAPILQGVPGGHWEFVFDVMENNLEVR